MASSDVTSVSKYFATANEGFNTTLGSTIVSGATSVPLNSTVGLMNGNVFVGIIEPGATAQQVFTGTVDVGGSQITNVVWTRGSNTGHAGGVTIVDYSTGTARNMTTAGILKQHTQAGAHTGITTDTISTTSNATVGGNETVAGTLAVTGALTAAGIAMSGSLTGTGLGAQVQTQANAGTAGGTFSYINLGGIKLLWCISANQNTGLASNNYTFTLPVGFFSTLTSISVNPVNMTTDNRQNVGVAATPSPTTITVAAWYPLGGAATVGINLFVIGT